MDMLPGAGLLFLFGWMFGVSIGLGVLQLALSPLSIPRFQRPSRSGKHRTTSGEWVLAAFFLFAALNVIGVVILLPAYLLMRWCEVKNRPVNESRGDETPEASVPATKEPFFPQFALSELIAMVFSIGCAPLYFALLYLESVRDISATVIVAAAVLFPIAFLRSAQRLNARRVPNGALRTAFVFVFPYMIYSCLFICGRGAALMVFLLLGEMQRLARMTPFSELGMRMGVAAAFFIGGAVLAKLCRLQADDSVPDQATP